MIFIIITKNKDVLMEPNNVHGLERRKHSPESQHRYLEFKNNFRIDFRQRIDLFAKTILLASAGALTISISLFLGDKGPTVPADSVSNLQLAWAFLFFTIIAISFGHFLILLQGQYVNKHWDGKVPLGDDQISGNQTMSMYRLVIGTLGLFGFVSFILGMFLLAFVTMRTIAFIGS